MDFPHGGAPATRPDRRKLTVVLAVEVNVIDHQLTYNFYLPSLKGFDAGEGPLRVTSVRSHFGDDAAFFQFAEIKITGLGMAGPGAGGKSGIEANPEVIVKGAGSRKLAVAGLTNGWESGRALAGVFREIEVADDCVDVTLAKSGKLFCEFRVIGAVQRFRELGFELREGGGRQILS
jgi:hypothetical protein